MCGDGNSMVIMLDHRSTAVFIGRRFMDRPQIINPHKYHYEGSIICSNHDYTKSCSWDSEAESQKNFAC